MEAEMTRVSSRGQVVIPGLIILKKVGFTCPLERKRTLSSIRKRVKKLGITRRDVSRGVEAVRAKRAKQAL